MALEECLKVALTPLVTPMKLQPFSLFQKDNTGQLPRDQATATDEYPVNSCVGNHPNAF